VGYKVCSILPVACAAQGISFVKRFLSHLDQTRVRSGASASAARARAGVGAVSAAEARDFAAGALEALRRGSPRSLAVTLRHFAAVAAAVRGGAGPGSERERTRMPSRLAVLGHA